MMVQIEITTRCNYSCWYCTGRSMEQEDMSWDMFTSIVDNLPKYSTVKLQGEGEPTLWKYWWEGVAYIVKKGHRINTILNGSVIDIDKVVLYFKNIGVSLDTINIDEANTIGRFNVEKVKRNLLLLKEYLGNGLLVYITDSGQDLKETYDWLSSNRITYVKRTLLTNVDYVTIYPKDKEVKQISKLGNDKPKTCDYISGRNNFSYYTVKGQKLPCCFIKNPKDFSVDTAVKQFKAGIIPKHCTGCSYIKNVL